MADFTTDHITLETPAGRVEVPADTHPDAQRFITEETGLSFTEPIEINELHNLAQSFDDRMKLTNGRGATFGEFLDYLTAKGLVE